MASEPTSTAPAGRRWKQSHPVTIGEHDRLRHSFVIHGRGAQEAIRYAQPAAEQFKCRAYRQRKGKRQVRLAGCVTRAIAPQGAIETNFDLHLFAPLIFVKQRANTVIDLRPTESLNHQIGRPLHLLGDLGRGHRFVAVRQEYAEDGVDQGAL